MEFIRGSWSCPCHPFILCLFYPLRNLDHGFGPIDPKELLKGLDSFLNRDGEVKSVDGIG